jgi:hypothetical protein
MSDYAVSKQYGHFVQIWYVKAESKDDAWDRAEIDGKLGYQTVYKDVKPIRNYVTDIDNNINDNTISQEQYDRWLHEARQLGMKDDYYCGLPFNDLY